MKKPVLVLVLAMAVPTISIAQGCSDAGVCTAGAVGDLTLWQGDGTAAVGYRHSARLVYSYASGEQGTTIMQVIPELEVGLGPRLGLQVKVPYVSVSGNLGRNSGVGDLIATASYALLKEPAREVNTTLGLRVPTGTTSPERLDRNTFTDFHPLPMPYQTGLGTTDLLAGAEWRWHRYVVAVAYQHVLHQNNQNQFLHRFWADDPDALGYFGSYMLERADDAVVRFQYVYGCGKLALQPGLLAIYHVNEDTRLEDQHTSSDLSDVGMVIMDLKRMPVPGSQGITLNGTVDLRYSVSDRWAVEFSGGMPLITRKVRPDGLTREFVLNAGLRFRF